MSKKRVSNTQQRSSNILRTVALLSISAFVIKVIAQFNIPNGVWLGADGENYLNGVNGLIKDGIFSKESHLLMWPAGYPILIFLISKVHIAWTLVLTALLQGAFYSLSVYYFCKQLLHTKFFKYSSWVAFALLFNPTLSLSSLAIGYESSIAAGHLVIAALWLRSRNRKGESGRAEILIAACIGGLIVFMQPRLITSIFIFFVIWVFSASKRKNVLISVSVGLLIVLIFPFGLVERNRSANNSNSISTNLGYTLNIGFGDSATGGYTNKASGVPCQITVLNQAGVDNQRVGCVLKWATTHPLKTLKLSVAKAVFFWSPWSGPESNGTMARNPWLKLNPIQNISRDRAGAKLIYGWFGKIVSWLWLLGGIILMLLGFYALTGMGTTEKLLAFGLAGSIFAQMVISMLTIGDHRFRLPTMGFSLALQVLGLLFLFRKLPAPAK